MSGADREVKGTLARSGWRTLLVTTLAAGGDLRNVQRFTPGIEVLRTCGHAHRRQFTLKHLDGIR